MRPTSLAITACLALTVGPALGFGAAPATAALPTAALPTAAPVGCPRAVGGDATGDGRADPLIGVPGSRRGAGQVDLFTGTAKGIRPTGTVLRQGHGGLPGTARAGNDFGDTIATGDADGDGCADAAVLAALDRVEPSASDGATHVGSITVVYGHRGSGFTAAGAQLLTAHTLGIEHPAIGFGQGDAQDTTRQILGDPVFGDFDGDGHDDLALVDTVIDEDADATWARIAVVPGSATGLRLDATTEFLLPGARAGGVFAGQGIALATGDLRGGRTDDLIVAEGGTGDPSQTGRAVHGDGAHPVLHVVFGSAQGLGQGIADRVIDEETRGVPGTDDATGASRSVSVTTGDFDGDGRADIAWGLAELSRASVVYGAAAGIRSTGSQTFTSGRDGVQGSTREGGLTFGTVLASGDFNGDGDDELVLGSALGHISVLAGTHEHGLTATGDLRWTAGRGGIPGPATNAGAFGGELQTGFFGRGAGQDLLVGDVGANHRSGDVTEFFGSRTRNVGLVKAHATSIDEASPGVPGARTPDDVFGAALG